MTDIIPLFSSAASLKQGGIFTVDKLSDVENRRKQGRQRGPVSLCELAKQEGMKRLHLVDSTFVNFFAAYKGLKEVGCDLSFGLKLVVCEDMDKKDDASRKTESKVVLFMRSGAAYVPLAAIFSKASIDGFYYAPRLDWKTLRAMWSDELMLALPFYSSFLAKNTLTFATIAPDLPAEPLMLREMDQQLPFDGILNEAVDRYVAATAAPVQQVKSVYYRKRDDAKQFLIWRSIMSRGRRATWDKPNADGMHSREFSFDAWRELTGGRA